MENWERGNMGEIGKTGGNGENRAYNILWGDRILRKNGNIMDNWENDVIGNTEKRERDASFKFLFISRYLKNKL